MKTDDIEDQKIEWGEVESPLVCPECHGTGFRRNYEKDEILSPVCDSCKGTGLALEDK